MIPEEEEEEVSIQVRETFVNSSPGGARGAARVVGRDRTRGVLGRGKEVRTVPREIG